MEELILSDEIKCGYGRAGYAVIKEATCSITGEETLCVCTDSSEDEYRSICISMTYLIEKYQGIIDKRTSANNNR